MGSIAGERVTLERALSVPVVYNCLTAISESAGGLPFGIFRVGENERKPMDRHPLMEVFRAPNDEMTSFELFTQLFWDLAGSGNSFWRVFAGRLGPVSRLERLDPAYMTVERLPDGGRRYRYQEPGKPVIVLLEDEVWHIRDMPLVDGLVGMSRIDVGREAIGAAIGAQRYSAQFFRNDATPPFAIMMKEPFADASSRRNFLNAISTWWGGSNRHKPGVLENAENIVKMGHTNEESQLLETRKEQAYDIARIWRMPPHKVGLMDKATFSNIEQQSLEFVIDTLRPWLELVERSVQRFLITNPDRFAFEFNVSGLLRGDIKARYEAYAVGRNWGWLSVNEIRKLENMNPIAEGNVHLQPLNMQPAGEPQAGVWRDAPPVEGAVAAKALAQEEMQ